MYTYLHLILNYVDALHLTGWSSSSSSMVDLDGAVDDNINLFTVSIYDSKFTYNFHH